MLTKPLQRIVTGGTLAGVSFVVSGSSYSYLYFPHYWHSKGFQGGWGWGALCVEMGFKRTFPGNQNAELK